MLKMARKSARLGLGVGLKIASFAKKEFEKETSRVLHSKKARALAMQAASAMKNEAMRVEKRLACEIKKEILKANKARKKR